jgi:putative ABC transport system ATP-binding protein
MTTVTIEGLVIEYRRSNHVTRPIDGLDLSLPPGTLTVLLGPSGCGKTSLLSCLAGLMSPAAGRIVVGDTEVTALDDAGRARYARSGVGIVFQAFNLVPSLTARENVLVALRGAGVSRREADRRARKLLEEVGLADRVGHRPSELSGGQMQRVAIARALALNPQLVVADEPTASLDGVQIETVLRLLRRMTDAGRSVVVSTHDHRIVPLADTVVELGAHEPRVVTPDPSTLATHDLGGLGERVLQPGEVLFHEGDLPDAIYEVVSGELDLARSGAVVRVVQPGDVFGEMGPVFGLPRSASATAGPEGAVVRGSTAAMIVEARGRQFLADLIGRRTADLASDHDPAPSVGAAPH